MQFQHVIKLAGQDLAVASPWKWVPQSMKKIQDSGRDRTLRARLLSTDGYEPTRRVQRPGETPQPFLRALPTTKKKGLLMQDSDGNTFVVTASEVIGAWAEVEAVWNTREAQQQTEQLRREEQARIRSEAERGIQSQADTLPGAVFRTLQNLLGREPRDFDPSVRVVGEWSEDGKTYTPRIGGYIRVNPQDLIELIEQFGDMREEVEELRAELNREGVSA